MAALAVVAAVAEARVPLAVPPQAAVPSVLLPLLAVLLLRALLLLEGRVLAAEELRLHRSFSAATGGS